MGEDDGRNLPEVGRALGLQANAHAHGVVHLDLKPGNVMLGVFGEVLVMDWGVAMVLSDAEVASAATADDAVEIAAG